MACTALGLSEWRGWNSARNDGAWSGARTQCMRLCNTFNHTSNSHGATERLIFCHRRCSSSCQLRSTTHHTTPGSGTILLLIRCVVLPCAVVTCLLHVHVFDAACALPGFCGGRAQLWIVFSKIMRCGLPRLRPCPLSLQHSYYLHVTNRFQHAHTMLRNDQAVTHISCHTGCRRVA